MSMLMRRRRITDVAVMLGLVCVLTFGLSWGQVAPRPEQQEATRYEIITKGLLGNPIFPIQFHSGEVRLEVRDLIMGTGEAQKVPISTRTLMELRGGAVVTLINGEKQERRPGDFWEVEQGSTFSIVNKGEVAVIRAINIFEGGK